MPDLNSITSPVVGNWAEVEELPLRDIDQAATVCHWLINAGTLHPVITQWFIGIVRLSDLPGVPPAHLQFTGATHEVLMVAVDPDYPITAASAATPEHRLQPLNPVNLAHQFTATDDEMRLMAKGMAWAIAHGDMPPEPPLGYESFRHKWLTVMVKTLAHIRGEEHAP